MHFWLTQSARRVLGKLTFSAILIRADNADGFGLFRIGFIYPIRLQVRVGQRTDWESAPKTIEKIV